MWTEASGSPEGVYTSGRLMPSLACLLEHQTASCIWSSGFACETHTNGDVLAIEGVSQRNIPIRSLSGRLSAGHGGERRSGRISFLPEHSEQYSIYLSSRFPYTPVKSSRSPSGGLSARRGGGRRSGRGFGSGPASARFNHATSPFLMRSARSSCSSSSVDGEQKRFQGCNGQ